MGMTSVNISLPEHLKDYLDQRVQEGGYRTASEYVEQLITQERIRLAEERLTADLTEAERSGDPIPVTDAFWEERRRTLLARHQGKQTPRIRLR